MSVTPPDLVLKISDLELGWLAGILDGEGSVGIYRRISTTTGSHAYFPCVQMTTTNKCTSEAIVSLLNRLGARGHSYLYREKKPEKHRPSYHIRTVRLVDVALLAPIIGPVSVEKQKQWFVVGDFCTRRLAGREIYASGKVGLRGHRIHYTPEEVKLWEEARELNKRGPRIEGK